MIVPVTWDGERPGADFLCDSPPNSTCTIFPGVVDKDAQDSKIWVVNETALDTVIETGQVLAQEVPAEEGEVLIRRGLHPETGDMPECLEVVNGLFSACPYVDVEAERLSRLVNREGQSSVAGPQRDSDAAPAISLEYRGNTAYQRIEHTKPRVALYTPSREVVAKGVLPDGSYTGERITIGKFVDNGEGFRDETPWTPAEVLSKGKAEHVSMHRKWLGMTLLALTSVGLVYGQGSKLEGLCAAAGCSARAKHRCRNRCNVAWYCDKHQSPAKHDCPGGSAVLCEDTSKDAPFSVHLPLGERFDNSCKVTLPRIRVKFRMKKSYAVDVLDPYGVLDYQNSRRPHIETDEEGLEGREFELSKYVEKATLKGDGKVSVWGSWEVKGLPGVHFTSKYLSDGTADPALEERLAKVEEGSVPVDSICHLVQEEDVIMRIHSEEIPPDIYYEKLKDILDDEFPGTSEGFLDHIVAFVAAGDTATAFCVSFGIAKFQLAQTQVKLVGEIVSRQGRSPNPAICQAIRAWPSVKNLKDLQSFLGTLNYIRPHCGPSFTRVSAPLRELLKPDAVFPPNPAQLKSIEDLKALALETHVLFVPDEAAAIAAATAWLAGLPPPPGARPFEGTADTSKIAMGGVFGQASAENGKLLILMYWNAPLSPGQSQWHPQEQECWGIVQLKREAIKHFGRIPAVFHTDHGNLVRIEHLPLERIDAKHYRWHAEIVAGGCLLLYKSGTGAQHRGADALSRNPAERDLLLLARQSDWNQYRAVIRGIQQSIEDGEYASENPPLYEVDPSIELPEGVEHVPSAERALCPQCDIDLAPAICKLCNAPFCWSCFAEHPCIAGNAVKEKAAQSLRQARLQEQLCAVTEQDEEEPQYLRIDALITANLAIGPGECISSVVELYRNDRLSVISQDSVTALFLGPFAVIEEAEDKCAKWRDRLEELFELKISLIVGDPPFEVETDVDGKGYWCRPQAPKPEARKKMLRKHLLTSLMLVLSYVVRYRPKILVGIEQGGLVAALAALPALLEVACRQRIATTQEMQQIRQAWAHVAAIIVINPVMLPQRSLMSEVVAAVPEIEFLQPRGIFRCMIQGGNSYVRKKFGDDLAPALGIVSHDLESARNQDLKEEFTHCLLKPVPQFIEDDPSGVGYCAICEKRGVLGRCVVCGLLMHYTCVSSETPGAAQKCPRCAVDTSLEEIPDEPWRMGIHGHKYKGPSPPLDGRVLHSTLEQATDSKAKQHGFHSAKEWYHYSTGGALPRQVSDANFSALPSAQPEEVVQDSSAQQSFVLNQNVGYEPASADEALPVELGGEDLEHDDADSLAVELGLERPYYFADVETKARGEAEYCSSLRDDMHMAAKAVWHEDAVGTSIKLRPLPVVGWQQKDPHELTVRDLREALRDSQRACPEMQVVVRQLLDKEGVEGQCSADDSHRSSGAAPAEAPEKQKVKQRTSKAAKSAANLKCYQLASDGVLEFQSILALGALWVPAIPLGTMPFASPEISWRRWVFDQNHLTFLNPHRSFQDTLNHLRRMGWWSTMNADTNKWFLACPVCLQFRTNVMRPPMRSMLANDDLSETLPWEDVVIDAQGPFTLSDQGYQYIVSYHCTRLKVPKVRPSKTLQKGHFGRALLDCMFEAAVLPYIVRTDRGPEFRNLVMEELLSIGADAHRIFGTAFTPRHQGLGERGHQVILQNNAILMHAVCRAWPQEWSSLLGAIQFLYFTAAQNATGLSARDMSMGYAIAQDSHRLLMPFRVPKGMAETDIAARLFDNFRNLYSMFMRIQQEERLKDQLRINQKRWMRPLEIGDVVFRKLPLAARGSKRMFAPTSTGPYMVKGQKSNSSVILETPEGDLVDEGNNIPLTQILPGSKPKHITVPTESEVRPISQMLQQPDYAPKKAGQRAGWTGLKYNAFVAYLKVLGGEEGKLLTVGKVLVNHVGEEAVTVQPCRGCWEGLRVIHKLQYQTRGGYSDVVTTELAKERVPYAMIKFQVSLMSQGELSYDSVARIKPGRWGLKLHEVEHVNLLRAIYFWDDDEEGVEGQSSAAGSNRSGGAAPAGVDAQVCGASPIASSSQKPTSVAKDFAARMREHEANVTVLDEELLCSRSWTQAGDDLMTQIMRAGGPVPKFSGGEAAHSIGEIEQKRDRKSGWLDVVCMTQEGTWIPMEEEWELYFNKGESTSSIRRLVNPSGDRIAKCREVVADSSTPCTCILLHAEAKIPEKRVRNRRVSGYDLFADKDVVVPARSFAAIPTGVSVVMTEGWYGKIVPLKARNENLKGLTVQCQIIDGSKREEVKIAFFNHSSADITISKGSVVATMALEPLTPTTQSLPKKSKSIQESLRQVSEARADERIRKTRESAAKLQKTQPHKSVASYAKDEAEEVDSARAKEVTPESTAEAGKRTWGSPEFQRKQGHTEGHRKWMDRLQQNDLSGLEPDMKQFLLLQGQTLEENPRITPEYKEKCVAAAGLGENFDEERYPHLDRQADKDILAWAVRRISGCIWLEDSPRTYVRGFKHRLITRGPPIRMGLHRLSRSDTEWVEKAIQEDVARGQLVKGVSDWGFPAFPTKESAPHKAIKRKRRMVVDYRALNRVTVKRVFIIPNSDQIKCCVAGSLWFSVGDAKEGFNQCENEEGSGEKMAVSSVTGTYIPRGLTFGPTNGPEDFQELVFIVFGRRLYREWYLFIDDICVATGRKAATPAGPSGAHDVWGMLTEVNKPSQESIRALAAFHSGLIGSSKVEDPENESIARVGPERPPALFKAVYRFLHLFSGRSRDGDVAEALFIRGLEFGVLVITECWDTAHTLSHDLTLRDKVIGLLDMLEAGWYHGGHAAPPCNTFAQVLWVTPGPIPVRDRDHPWGLPAVLTGGSKKNRLRLAVGSWLFRVALAIIKSLALTGASSSLEHPADPEVQPYPSIWDMEETAAVEAISHSARKLTFKRRNLWQCMYSGPTPKPTTITLNCVNSEKLCRKCIHGRNHEGVQSSGFVDASGPGRFATAKLKEYPAPLCKKLAKVHLETMMMDRQERPFPRIRKLGVKERLMEHYPSEEFDRVMTLGELEIMGRTKSKMCTSPFAHLVVKNEKETNGVSVLGRGPRRNVKFNVGPARAPCSGGPGTVSRRPMLWPLMGMKAIRFKLLVIALCIATGVSTGASCREDSLIMGKGGRGKGTSMCPKNVRCWRFFAAHDCRGGCGKSHEDPGVNAQIAYYEAEIGAPMQPNSPLPRRSPGRMGLIDMVTGLRFGGSPEDYDAHSVTYVGNDAHIDGVLITLDDPDEVRDKDYSHIKCHRCGGAGHKARDCPGVYGQSSPSGSQRSREAAPAVTGLVRNVDLRTGYRYGHQCAGTSGFIFIKFITASLEIQHKHQGIFVGKTMAKIAASVAGLIPKQSVLARLVRQCLVDVGAAIRGARQEMLNGGDGVGRTEDMCEQGRHRSYFSASIKEVICQELDLEYRMIRQHCQNFPCYDMRVDCGCGSPEALFSKGKRRCDFLYAMAKDNGVSEATLLTAMAASNEIGREVIRCLVRNERRLLEAVGDCSKKQDEPSESVSNLSSSTMSQLTYKADVVDPRPAGLDWATIAQVGHMKRLEPSDPGWYDQMKQKVERDELKRKMEKREVRFNLPPLAQGAKSMVLGQSSSSGSQRSGGAAPAKTGSAQDLPMTYKMPAKPRWADMEDSAADDIRVRVVAIKARQEEALQEAIEIVSRLAPVLKESLGENDIKMGLFGSVQGKYCTHTSDMDLILFREAPEGVQDGEWQTRDKKRGNYAQDASKRACAKIAATLERPQTLPESLIEKVLECGHKQTVEFEFEGRGIDLHVAHKYDVYKSSILCEGIVMRYIMSVAGERVSNLMLLVVEWAKAYGASSVRGKSKASHIKAFVWGIAAMAWYILVEPDPLAPLAQLLTDCLGWLLAFPWSQRGISAPLPDATGRFWIRAGAHSEWRTATSCTFDARRACIMVAKKTPKQAMDISLGKFGAPSQVTVLQVREMVVDPTVSSEWGVFESHNLGDVLKGCWNVGKDSDYGKKATEASRDSYMESITEALEDLSKGRYSQKVDAAFQFTRRNMALHPILAPPAPVAPRMRLQTKTSVTVAQFEKATAPAMPTRAKASASSSPTPVMPTRAKASASSSQSSAPPQGSSTGAGSGQSSVLDSPRSGGAAPASEPSKPRRWARPGPEVSSRVIVIPDDELPAGAAAAEAEEEAFDLSCANSTGSIIRHDGVHEVSVMRTQAGEDALPVRASKGEWIPKGEYNSSEEMLIIQQAAVSAGAEDGLDGEKIIVETWPGKGSEPVWQDHIRFPICVPDAVAARFPDGVPLSTGYYHCTDLDNAAKAIKSTLKGVEVEKGGRQEGHAKSTKTRVECDCSTSWELAQGYYGPSRVVDATGQLTRHCVGITLQCAPIPGLEVTSGKNQKKYQSCKEWAVIGLWVRYIRFNPYREKGPKQTYPGLLTNYSWQIGYPWVENTSKSIFRSDRKKLAAGGLKPVIHVEPLKYRVGCATGRCPGVAGRPCGAACNNREAHDTGTACFCDIHNPVHLLECSSNIASGPRRPDQKSTDCSRLTNASDSMEHEADRLEGILRGSGDAARGIDLEKELVKATPARVKTPDSDWKLFCAEARKALRQVRWPQADHHVGKKILEEYKEKGGPSKDALEALLHLNKEVDHSSGEEWLCAIISVHIQEFMGEYLKACRLLDWNLNQDFIWTMETISARLGHPTKSIASFADWTVWFPKSLNFPWNDVADARGGDTDNDLRSVLLEWDLAKGPDVSGEGAAENFMAHLLCIICPNLPRKDWSIKKCEEAFEEVADSEQLANSGQCSAAGSLQSGGAAPAEVIPVQRIEIEFATCYDAIKVDHTLRRVELRRRRTTYSRQDDLGTLAELQANHGSCSSCGRMELLQKLDKNGLCNYCKEDQGTWVCQAMTGGLADADASVRSMCGAVNPIHRQQCSTCEALNPDATARAGYKLKLTSILIGYGEIRAQPDEDSSAPAQGDDRKTLMELVREDLKDNAELYAGVRYSFSPDLYTKTIAWLPNALQKLYQVVYPHDVAKMYRRVHEENIVLALEPLLEGRLDDIELEPEEFDYLQKQKLVVASAYLKGRGLQNPETSIAGEGWQSSCKLFSLIVRSVALRALHRIVRIAKKALLETEYVEASDRNCFVWKMLYRDETSAAAPGQSSASDSHRSGGAAPAKGQQGAALRLHGRDYEGVAKQVLRPEIFASEGSRTTWQITFGQDQVFVCAERLPPSFIEGEAVAGEWWVLKVDGTGYIPIWPVPQRSQMGGRSSNAYRSDEEEASVSLSQVTERMMDFLDIPVVQVEAPRSCDHCSLEGCTEMVQSKKPGASESYCKECAVLHKALWSPSEDAEKRAKELQERVDAEVQARELRSMRERRGLPTNPNDKEYYKWSPDPNLNVSMADALGASAVLRGRPPVRGTWAGRVIIAHALSKKYDAEDEAAGKKLKLSATEVEEQTARLLAMERLEKMVTDHKWGLEERERIAKVGEDLDVSDPAALKARWRMRMRLTQQKQREEDIAAGFSMRAVRRRAYNRLIPMEDLLILRGVLCERTRQVVPDRSQVWRRPKVKKADRERQRQLNRRQNKASLRVCIDILACYSEAELLRKWPADTVFPSWYRAYARFDNIANTSDIDSRINSLQVDLQRYEKQKKTPEVRGLIDARREGLAVLKELQAECKYRGECLQIDAETRRKARGESIASVDDASMPPPPKKGKHRAGKKHKERLAIAGEGASSSSAAATSEAVVTVEEEAAADSQEEADYDWTHEEAAGEPNDPPAERYFCACCSDGVRLEPSDNGEACVDCQHRPCSQCRDLAEAVALWEFSEEAGRWMEVYGPEVFVCSCCKYRRQTMAEEADHQSPASGGDRGGKGRHGKGGSGKGSGAGKDRGGKSSHSPAGGKSGKDARHRPSSRPPQTKRPRHWAMCGCAAKHGATYGQCSAASSQRSGGAAPAEVAVSCHPCADSGESGRAATPWAFGQRSAVCSPRSGSAVPAYAVASGYPCVDILEHKRECGEPCTILDFSTQTTCGARCVKPWGHYDSQYSPHECEEHLDDQDYSPRVVSRVDSDSAVWLGALMCLQVGFVVVIQALRRIAEKANRLPAVAFTTVVLVHQVQPTQAVEDMVQLVPMFHQTMQAYSVMHTGWAAAQYYSLWKAFGVVDSVTEEIVEFAVDSRVTVTENLSWGLAAIVQATVCIYVVAAIWTAWSWSSRWLRTSELRERRYASDWPTWYAPGDGAESQSGAAKNKGGSASRELFKTSWRQSLESTCKKFSKRNSEGALIPTQSLVTSESPKRRMVVDYRYLNEATSISEASMAGLQASTRKAHAAVSEASWTGPHFSNWRAKLCKMRSKSQPAIGKRVICEEVQVATNEEYESLSAVVPLTGGDILLYLLRIIDAAKPNSQLMVMAFTMDHGLVVRALVAAQARGCTIRVLCDHKAMYGGASTSQRDAICALLNCGIEVMTYRLPKGGKNASLHAKMLIVSKKVMILGSANFTHNSLDSCVEAGVCTRHLGTLEEMERFFLEIYASGSRVIPDQLQSGPEWFKKKEAQPREESAAVAEVNSGQRSAANSQRSEACAAPAVEVTSVKQETSGAATQGTAAQSEDPELRTQQGGSTKVRGTRQTKSRMLASLSWCGQEGQREKPEFAQRRR